MSSSPQNIAVNIDDCSTHCLESCDASECHLCLPCLLEDPLEDIFHQSYREHQRRGEFLRVFPTTRYSSDSEEFKEQMTEKTQKLSLWFEGKCEIDEDFCR